MIGDHVGDGASKIHDLFKKASEYEKFTRKGSKRIFRWNEKYYLEDMIKPENKQKILDDYKKINQRPKKEIKPLFENL